MCDAINKMKEKSIFQVVILQIMTESLNRNHLMSLKKVIYFVN